MTDTLFFVLSKLFWFLVQPESWCVILLFLAWIALVRQWLNMARRLVGLTLALTLLIGFLPIGQVLVRPLETRFPAMPDLKTPAGIIVLGGAEDPRMAHASGLPETNDAGERLSAGVALALAYPDAPLIFAGGSGAFMGQGFSGATMAKNYFLSFGIPAERMILEHGSRNTAENAALTLEITDQTKEGPWVLVTSAFHMPRSVATFCAAGWRNIQAFPVDYRGVAPLRVNWSFSRNLDLLDIALKEWIGLVAYEVTGRVETKYAMGC
jgi:uncharacterized SAM-binding protein YcdF (DUF218 family)